MMWTSRKKFQNRAINVFLVLLIIYVLYALFPFFQTIGRFITLVLYPFFIAGIFYYLLRPIVKWLAKRMSIWIAIPLTFFILAAFIILGIIYIYPILAEQIKLLLEVKQNIPIGKIKGMVENYLSDLNSLLLKNIIAIIQLATDFIVVLVAVPFILFYLLKDDKLIHKKLLSYISDKYIDNPESFLKEMDTTLIQYINSRVLVSIFTSVFVLISFIAIGINYPFLLFFSSLLFYIVPTIGCFIAAIPPLVIGFSMSTFMGIEAAIIMIIASLLEGFVITPKIMGDGLYIHPLMIVFVLLVAGFLFGILGLILAVPFYALLRIIIKHIEPTQKENIGL